MNNSKEENLKTKIRSRLNNWKASAEYLHMQLHLGTKEAREEFEEQKKSLGDWIDNQSKKLQNTKDITHKKALELKASLEELRVQAALGKAETEDALKEQHKKLNESIHNLKQEINEVYGNTKGKVNEYAEEINETLDEYHTRFDLFRLQAHLAKMDSTESWNKKKKELSAKLHDLGVKLESNKEQASDKWDNFSDEMSEAWSHIRNAFKS